VSAQEKPAPVAPIWSTRAFPVLFGLFLGLCVLKFGNPVVLDHRIDPPTDLAGWISQPWPVRWSFPLLLIAAVSALAFGRPYSRFREARVPVPLLVLPLLWLGWQFLSSTGSVDAALSEVTLRQLAACVGCFAVGFICLSPGLRRSLLWVGLLLGFLFCLNRAAQQRLFEFRQDYEALVEGQSNGWTNFNPAVLDQMRRDQLLVTTNGVEVANPAILDKMRRARVSGTLVYPNALAGMVLLLLPASLAVLAAATRGMKDSIRKLVLGCAAALGLAVLFWTGSKAGWLVAIAVGTVWVAFQPLSARLRFLLVAGVLAAGLTVFGLRFSGYFAKGATSAAARMDYWKVAVQNTRDRPVFGSGPGTFQRPYARLKPPEAEMARLVHNDFLEQATDSGVPGFLLYGVWVGWGLWFLGRRHAVASASTANGSPGLPVETAVFFGLLAWFLHGMAEFGLYIPASAWTAFTLFGALLGEPARTSTPSAAAIPDR
jgi:hypothetical protein